MFNLMDEKDKYLTVCKSMKGLSNLTIKAYRIDLWFYGKTGLL